MILVRADQEKNSKSAMGNNIENLAQVRVVAGVVIKEGGKYLLIQENSTNPDIHGLWNFPAGRVEKGATIEETAIREAKEESGYDVKLVKKIAIFHESADMPVKHAFEAKIIGGELKWPENEILDAKWFTWQEIQEMKDGLRGEWIIGAISIMENGK